MLQFVIAITYNSVCRQTMKDQIATELRSKGFRLTPQRLKIYHILAEAGAHLSPVEVFERARQELPGLTEPTVYRTLQFLRAQGLLVAGEAGSGNLVYEVADHLHHHLVCRSCGNTVEIDHGTLDGLYADLKAQTGFEIDSRHLTLYGLCPDCQPT